MPNIFDSIDKFVDALIIKFPIKSVGSCNNSCWRINFAKFPIEEGLAKIKKIPPKIFRMLSIAFNKMLISKNL